jgi:GntR family transcriptional regulator of vanillate catabolism
MNPTKPRSRQNRPANVVPLKLAAPVRNATRSQSVTQTLREAILNGEFAPGERIQEVPLSQRFQVSRTPVRAALQSLAAAGMLEYSANRGYSVRRLRRGELVTIYDIRAVLEGLACRFVAEHGLGAQDRANFERALEEGDRILREPHAGPREREAYRRVNVTIHETIVRASGSRMLAEMMSMCHNVPMSSNRNIVWNNSSALARRHDDHHRIFNAIIRREPGRAELLMREHVHCVKVEIEQRLGDASELNAE